MTNRLANETSPYLLQHKDNPVDWYPWGEEAFEKAEKENKIIFLSIGYSTCHWCHIMERESFEDEKTAEVLNKDFVAIKVDREERPDLDTIYMAFCQAMTGSGGWPLNLFLTPKKVPFYAGTYFPKKSIYGQPAFVDLLNQVAKIWEENPAELFMHSEKARVAVASAFKPRGEEALSGEIIRETYETLKSNYDEKYGGFSEKPKFPSPHQMLFLLRYYKAAGEMEALEMVKGQLEGMAKGGLMDHAGGGFARYSVDERWEIPHFEKMLYDNALIAESYIEAYAITKKDRFKNVSEELFHYIEREMTSPHGAFYSAQDADSEGEEGKFYVFSPSEIEEALGEEAEWFIDFYGITKRGNFEGKNHLNLIHKDSLKREDLEKAEPLLDRLYEYRKDRVPPFKDDKILTSWNGLMISALSLGGKVFKEESYLQSARKAADFILNYHIREAVLYNSSREGKLGDSGTLEDYAFLIHGLLNLYDATLEDKWLFHSRMLTEKMIEDFIGGEDGGFYMTSKDKTDLIMRPRETYDGAMPSGISMAVMVLAKISRLTGVVRYREIMERQFKVFSSNLKKTPGAHCYFMAAYLTANMGHKAYQLYTVSSEEALEYTEVFRQEYRPFDTLISLTNEGILRELFDLEVQEAPALLICQEGSCQKPLERKEDIEKELKI
ncbi:thioredoxin domain-containing protein [Gallicola sp. Sow4_E12]|uniref:thioredoxin domain-containing protein n=1 Tax=Gallicola sp. Sow4_E12 TaxID=3438785 RepID=UPI003F900B5D